MCEVGVGVKSYRKGLSPLRAHQAQWQSNGLATPAVEAGEFSSQANVQRVTSLRVRYESPYHNNYLIALSIGPFSAPAEGTP